MQDRTGTTPNSAARVGARVPWTVVHAEPLPGYRLKVRFVDGVEGVVDASGMILGSKPGVFEVLRDPDAFAQVRLEDGVVTWPGDLDLARDAMYDEIKAHGEWVLN